MPPKISIFSSSIRSKLWPAFFNSLEGTLEGFDIEVIFSGHIKKGLDIPKLPLGISFTYIDTGNIKPAQCYSISSRHCTGETISWSCDDAEYPNDILGKAYRYWKSQNNEKLILSIQTKESGYNYPKSEIVNMNIHRFFGAEPSAPLMAPMCLMSRKFFNDLGGLDQRYICGQYENDIVMRAYRDGATVKIFGDKDCYIEIDHLGKSIAIGESKDEEDFIKRPFSKGYVHDRKVLEESWCYFDRIKAYKRLEAGEKPISLLEISPFQLDKFQPYPEEISLTESHGPKGDWD